MARDFCLSAALLSLAIPANAQIERIEGGGSSFNFVEKASLQLALDRESYAPGDEVSLAAVVTIDPGWHIQSYQPSLEYLIPSELTLSMPADWPAPRVEWPPDKLWQFDFETEPLAVYDGVVTLIATFTVPTEAETGTLPIEGSLYFQACDDRQCVAPTDTEGFIALTVGERGPAINQELFNGTAMVRTETPDKSPGPASTAGGVAAVAPVAGRSLFAIVLLGILGGLILNAMPCVLPILSLKVFGLLKKADKGRSAVVTGSLATAAGILVSFWALAALAIAARSAGKLVGWGIQFQNPVFVVLLTAVLILFCMNLWGVFEIPLPRRLADRAAAATHQGLAGHFATGLFATLMATPCSAPFLGTAVGFALGQTSLTTMIVFTAIGFGMALPYLTLAIFPGAAAIFPRPGAWMEQLRGFMGFLLAGTAIWLFYVLAAQLSSLRLAFVEGGLLLLATGLWLRARSSSAAWKSVGWATALIALAGTTWLAQTGRQPSGQATRETRLIEWQMFERTEAERLSQEGQLVFVDVTADWCATCKVNERLVLETETIDSLFERHAVVPMRADWTNRDDDISQFLADYGRYAIPFYILYRPGREPHAFGELLTKGELARVVEESVAVAGSSG